jgi:hypothetical protein
MVLHRAAVPGAVPTVLVGVHQRHVHHRRGLRPGERHAAAGGAEQLAPGVVDRPDLRGGEPGGAEAVVLERGVDRLDAPPGRGAPVGGDGVVLRVEGRGGGGREQKAREDDEAAKA